MVYALKMRYKIGPSKGYEGYHSVYQDEKLANHMEKLRNKLHGTEIAYRVVAVKPEGYKLSKNWRKETIVSFGDSSYSWMLIDTTTYFEYLRSKGLLKYYEEQNEATK